MTLSSWLRDYLYFPLGGSRVGAARAYFNLGLTMFLIGLWHGAAWTFVIYGLLQAVAMLGHRYLYRRSGRSADSVDSTWIWLCKVVGTLHFVVLSRAFFRGTSVDNALDMLGRLGEISLSIGHVPINVLLVLATGLFAHYTPRSWVEQTRVLFVALPTPLQGVVLAGLGAGLSTLASQDVVPYIYFQF
jgi:D-alanyl-lipoteichoic acid acyltransferase DltB (MBOAT superfamily)